MAIPASGGSFANIAGATSSTYTAPAAQASNNGTLFRAVVTNAGGSVNSSAATLNVLSGTTPFITGSSPGAARNVFEGWVGMIMTVGANPLIVSSMGRVCAPGNRNPHRQIGRRKHANRHRRGFGFRKDRRVHGGAVRLQHFA